jgi:hypothetical protein
MSQIELSFKARVINTREELDNMMKRDHHRNYTEEDLLVVSKYFDRKNYQPYIIYAIKEPNKDFMAWQKFVVPLELTVKEKENEEVAKSSPRNVADYTGVC